MQLRESIYVYLYETCKYGSHSFFLIYSICFMRTLQIQDVSLSFGDREILKDINLTMNEKSRAALVGANGSGKTSVLNALGRMQSIVINSNKNEPGDIIPRMPHKLTASQPTEFCCIFEYSQPHL